MDFYLSSIILISLLMIAMTIHVIRYSGFNRQQKTWYIVTFISVLFCAGAEYAVHCGSYDPAFAVPLTVLTVIQFSVAPCMAVFFSGALGLHRQARIALLFFIPHMLIEIVFAPFSWIFHFDADGYHRGKLFVIYSAFYILSLIYLMVSMLVVERNFRHRDKSTIFMIALTLIAGIVPVTFLNIHTAYISIGMAACLCYIYYNDLVQEDTREELIAGQKKITQMQEDIISGLASIIESRDTDTGLHVSRTREHVKLIAEGAMKEGVYTDEIDDRYVDLIYTLAPIHDVGKIVVSDAILKKPGKLTPEEFEQIKEHARSGGVIARRILSGVTDESYLKFASDIATYHHERWDGSGYPEGLKGEEIPLCARIMAIADVYDALTSERCYKKAIPPKEAVKIIKEESGTHFDPKLVEIFLKYINETDYTVIA
ncbi:MAG: HD domain-containing protein [Ruminococcus sp.]|uniref:HD-GYP domain-containing protein n=1 Tax=Ruminococcus sp. TaxID=41978 RepID=UPI002873031C|nr:HD domain-containing phosphohydrolase [Ruminococcus sp.]MBQ3285759.1 HD domain-containing protein [Ruminococcus sp.]